MEKTNYNSVGYDVLANIADYLVSLVRTHNYTMNAAELESYRKIVRRSFRGYDVAVLEGGLEGIRRNLLIEREDLMKRRLAMPASHSA